MDTNYKMLRTFDFHPENYGVCTGEEVKQIEEHFKIKERSDVELQNLRDFVVMYYHDLAHQKLVDEDRNTEYLKIMDTMSAVTGVIDEDKWNRGMEV